MKQTLFLETLKKCSIDTCVVYIYIIQVLYYAILLKKRIFVGCTTSLLYTLHNVPNGYIKK